MSCGSELCMLCTNILKNMSCGSELCCARIYYLLGKNSFCYSGTFLPCRKKWFDSSRIWRKCSFATNTCFPGSNKMSKEWTYSEAYFYNRCQFNNKLFEMKPFRLPSLFIRNKRTEEPFYKSVRGNLWLTMLFLPNLIVLMFWALLPARMLYCTFSD